MIKELGHKIKKFSSEFSLPLELFKPQDDFYKKISNSQFGYELYWISETIKVCTDLKIHYAMMSTAQIQENLSKYNSVHRHYTDTLVSCKNIAVRIIELALSGKTELTEELKEEMTKVKSAHTSFKSQVNEISSSKKNRNRRWSTLHTINQLFH